MLEGEGGGEEEAADYHVSESEVARRDVTPVVAADSYIECAASEDEVAVVAVGIADIEVEEKDEVAWAEQPERCRWVD